MIIGFIEPGLHICGGIRRILEVSNRLKERGNKVFIFTPDGKPPKWWPENKVDVLKISNLRAVKLDVCVYNLADQYVHAVRSNSKVKIFWVLAPEGEYNYSKHVPRSLNQKDVILMANSTYTKNYIHRYRKIDTPYDIKVIPGGINPKHFKYDPKIKKELNVLFYGSRRSWKGTDLIMKALRALKLNFAMLEGSGTRQEHMYTMYNKSMMFVSAAFREGFGFPELEAMACGCPVVCTDTGGNNDFIIPEHNAVVVDRDPLAIKEGIVRVLKDKNLRIKLRHNGFSTAYQKKFTWEYVVEEFENYIGSFL